MVRIDPIYIREKYRDFNKNTFGGFTTQDVKNFLENLAQQINDENFEKQRLETELSVTKIELSRLREIEDRLLKAIDDANMVGQVTREQARQQAEITLQDAQLKARQIIDTAQLQARKMLDEANNKAYTALTTMRKELKQLDEQYVLLEQQRNALLNEMKSFVQETQVKISLLEAQQRTVFYKEEVQKANEMMQKNNQIISQQTNNPITLTKTTATPANTTTASFFDSLGE
jgi:cell division initiation protein